MQWSQIKTLFILCFFLLDIYLLIQFTDKQKKEDLDVLKEQISTIEDNLKADNITISDDVSNEVKDGTYIAVKKQVFSEEEVRSLKAASTQETAIIDQEFIISKLKDPVKVEEDATNEAIAGLVKNELELVSPESYKYWGWNKEMNVLLFFQTKKNRPIYFNPNGIVLVYLNQENEIDFYSQTLLGEIDEESGEQKVTPIQAISVLYQRNELTPNTEVSKVELGYFTRIPLDNATQVFAPTWQVTTGDKVNYFVNAIEPSVFTSDDLVFLTDSMQRMTEKVMQIEKNEELKEYLLKQLENRVIGINRSESE
ncbi:two-component system regulatory protein YycI [Virgibacillus flavescens]|uniref:two-component system regulatory protein YycI n=1 Tax=Virgibacillus flavescens TaxID=1611422 RepID=UPI003D33FC02